MLVAVELPDSTDLFQEMFQEMIQLCYSANSNIINTFIQKRKSPDPSTMVGSGKVEELREIVVDEKIDLVIFMNNLRPSQQTNLSEALKVRVIDRQALILDIFAQRARTREGKMQVELALLNYLLPRLKGLGPVLSKLGGGIGTRGPGETMLETDRRHVKRRIHSLKKDLDKHRAHREVIRKSRHNKGFLMASIVGYTNAGKSTILNNMANQSVDVGDKLFATLDPTSGKLYLGEGVEIVVVDTVGFIRHLPHQLAAAFKATLEEVREADIIIRVLDVSHHRWSEHNEVTEQVLEEMACDNKPTLLLLNKTDLLSDKHISEIRESLPDGIPISALKRNGLDRMANELLSVSKEYYPDFIKRFRKEDGYKWYREYISKDDPQTK